MKRETAKLLLDVHRACLEIEQFSVGENSTSIHANRGLQPILHRLLKIVGEALNELSRSDSETATRVPNLRRFVNQWLRHPLCSNAEHDGCGIYGGDRPCVCRSCRKSYSDQGQVTDPTRTPGHDRDRGGSRRGHGKWRMSPNHRAPTPFRSSHRLR